MGSYRSGIRYDYKDAPPAVAVNGPCTRWPWLAAGLTTPLFAVSLIFISTGSEAGGRTGNQQLVPGRRTHCIRQHPAQRLRAT